MSIEMDATYSQINIRGEEKKECYLGRVDNRTALNTLYSLIYLDNSKIDSDTDVIRFEDTLTIPAEKLNTKITLHKPYDNLHYIRTDPPLPISMSFSGVNVIDSAWNERGIEFPEPIPLYTLAFCELLYIIKGLACEIGDVTVIVGVSYNKRNVHTSQIIELTNGAVLRIADGIACYMNPCREKYGMTKVVRVGKCTS